MLSRLTLLRTSVQECTDTVIVQVLNAADFHEKLGFSVNQLLAVALQKSSLQIKIDSLQVIQAWIERFGLFLHHTKDRQVSEPFSSPKDLLASFLPGICQHTLRIVTSDDKQHRSLYIACWQLFQKLISFVFEEQKVKQAFEGKSFPILVDRTSTWRLNTGGHLKLIVKRIVNATLVQSVQVQQTLLSSCVGLAEHFHTEITASEDQARAFKVYGALINELLVPVLNLAQSSFVQTREPAQQFMSKYVKKLNQDSLAADLFTENLQSFISTFADSLDCSESLKLSLLCSFLEIVSKADLVNLFASRNQGDRLWKLLSDVGSIDTHPGKNSIALLENSKVSDETNWFGYEFKHIKSKDARHKWLVCCQHMGSILNDQVLLDYAFEALNESETFHLSSLLVLIHSLSNLQEFGEVNCLVENCAQVLEEKLDALVKDDCEDSSLVLQIALIIQLIATSAPFINLTERPVYLKQCLPLFLSNLNSPHFPISTNAKAATAVLSQKFSYDSVQKLIHSNIHHFNSFMLIRFNNLSGNEPVHLSFQTLLNMSDKNVTPKLSLLLDQLLGSLERRHQRINIEPICQTLLLIVKFLDKHFSNPSSYPSLQFRPEKSEKEQFETNLREFVHSKLISSSLKDFQDEDQKQENDQREQEYETKETHEMMNSNEEQDKEKKFCLHVDLAKKILERCSHLLAHDQLQIRLLALETVHHGLLILAECEGNLGNFLKNIFTKLLNIILTLFPPFQTPFYQLLI